MIGMEAEMEERLYKVEQVAVIINTSVKTINNWYAYKKQNPKDDRVASLPQFIQRGNRQTRYWREKDIPALIQFKSTIPLGRNGFMGSVTQKYYKKKEKEDGKE